MYLRFYKYIGRHLHIFISTYLYVHNANSIILGRADLGVYWSYTKQSWKSLFQNYYISKETCLQIFDQSPESGSCWLHFQGDSEVFSCREIYAKYLFFFSFWYNFDANAGWCRLRGARKLCLILAPGIYLWVRPPQGCSWRRRASGDRGEVQIAVGTLLSPAHQYVAQGARRPADVSPRLENEN